MKSNKHITRLVTGLTGTSIIAQSCSGFYMEDYQVVEKDLTDIGASAIQIKLSTKDIQYLHFLDKIGNDIITNPEIAHEFAKDPQLYIQKYGYNEDVDIEENMLKLILALGDYEINRAVKNGDIKSFLNLLKNKNLLNNNSYNEIQLTNDDTTTIEEALRPEDSVICGLAAACVFYVAMAVVSVVAVAYTAAAAVTLAATLGVYTSVDTVSKNIHSNLFIDNYPVLKIWHLKGDTTKTFIAADLYIEEVTDKTIEAIETIDPNAFKGSLSKEDLKNIIKLNILKS